jgi:hypothetical protein
MARLHLTADAGSGDGARSAPQVIPAIVPEARQNRAYRANYSQLARLGEVKENEGFTKKSDDRREADFRLANRHLQPLGHLTARES